MSETYEYTVCKGRGGKPQLALYDVMIDFGAVEGDRFEAEVKGDEIVLRPVETHPSPEDVAETWIKAVHEGNATLYFPNDSAEVEHIPDAGLNFTVSGAPHVHDSDRGWTEFYDEEASWNADRIETVDATEVPVDG